MMTDLNTSTNNPYLRQLTGFAYTGMVLGIILGFAGLAVEILFIIGLTLFSLGFLSVLSFYVASAISWNAGAIAYPDLDIADIP